MNEFHSLKASTRSPLEGVGAEFVVEGLLRAQEKTRQIVGEILAALQAGMTEGEARKLALEIFAQNGVRKHWHQPWIRFGAGTLLTFSKPLQPDYRLQIGDPIFLDLGPVWSEPGSSLEYEGDFGDSFVFGGVKNAEAENCIAAAKQLFAEAQTDWKEKKLTGEEIYRFLKTRASDLGYLLIEEAGGHRVSDFPHQKYSREPMAKLAFTPTPSLWILEVQIRHPELPIGAFFEDILGSA